MDFSSHSHLKYIVEGRRNLSKKTLLKISQALEFNFAQGDYFEKLVFFNQAETLEEKNHYFAKLLQFSRFKKLEASQLQMYEEWYHVVIREMVGLKAFRGNPEWIGNQLLPKLEAGKAADSLAMLLRQGLLIKSANGYQQADETVTTDNEVRSIAVKRYHTHMIGQALQALNKLPSSQRDISSVTFSIKREDFPKLKKHLQFMRKELRGFAAGTKDGDCVVQINFQLFPMTKGI